MALSHNRQLLIEHEDVDDRLFTAAATPTLQGYTVEPLVSFPQRSAQLSAGFTSDHWLVARETEQRLGRNPWDAAHEAAEQLNYKNYIEPDILHERETSDERGKEDFTDTFWPPHSKTPAPGWHLDEQHTGFASVRSKATGKTIRIAHLDTGYTPDHFSAAGMNILTDYEKDFWDKKDTAVDPSHPGKAFAGHGTATLALLAAGRLKLSYGDQTFDDIFGGAPDAEIIPVRISPSVIHAYTSSMALGLDWALRPKGDLSKRCDVVTISHGGLPTKLWATAVNALYEHGTVVVAASGDSVSLTIINIATRFTVYPSCFNRVITALGAASDRTPYKTKGFGHVQGCWGPDTVMRKAIAAYTPNVAWMKFKDKPPQLGFDMHGAGTSSSTPQVAAACALWLQLYGKDVPADWRRVEACRWALFDSALDHDDNKKELGHGVLNVKDMLCDNRAKAAIEKATSGEPSPADSVSHPILRLLFGLDQPEGKKLQMYETELVQVLKDSKNVNLQRALFEIEGLVQISQGEKRIILEHLAKEDLSRSAREFLNAA